MSETNYQFALREIPEIHQCQSALLLKIEFYFHSHLRKFDDRSLQFQMVKFGNERKNQDGVGDAKDPLGDDACEVKSPASVIRSPLVYVA